MTANVSAGEPCVIVDGGAVSWLLEHAAVVFLTARDPDELVAVYPFAGSARATRISWPGIKSVAIFGGRLCILDDTWIHVFDDLHLRIIAGSYGAGPLPRESMQPLAASFPLLASHLVSNGDTEGLIVTSDPSLTPPPGLSDLFQDTGSNTFFLKVATDSPKLRHASIGALRLSSAKAPIVEFERVLRTTRVDPDWFSDTVLSANTALPRSTDATSDHFSVLTLQRPDSRSGSGHISLGAGRLGTSFVYGSTMNDVKLFVTGPQRSGTTFIAHALSYDLGIPHIDEEDFQTFDFQFFDRLTQRAGSWVAQAPALFHCLEELRMIHPDVIPVVVRRSIADIIKSQERIKWHREEQIERRNNRVPASDHRPIAEIKYARWDDDRFLFPTFIDVPFEVLALHPLYKNQREGFSAKRWQ